MKIKALLEECVLCSSKDVVEVVKNETFKYLGNKFIVKDYRTAKCNTCGESFADDDSNDRADLEVEKMRR